MEKPPLGVREGTWLLGTERAELRTQKEPQRVLCVQ